MSTGSHKLDELAELPQDVRIKRLRNLAKSHDVNNNDVIEADELKEWVLESFRCCTVIYDQNNFILMTRRASFLQPIIKLLMLESHICEVLILELHH